jgi:hypothetical protein
MASAKTSCMQRKALASTAVASVGYDDATLVLEIEFSSGRIYQYAEVPRSVYEWLLRTPSKGGYVARMINDRYPYRDITEATGAPQADLMQQLQDSLRTLEEKKPR